jgi:hypothetical protein
MQYTSLIAGLVVGAILACVASWAIVRTKRDDLTSQLVERVSQIRDLENQLHLQARDGLEERNQAIVEESTALLRAREAAFEEGREYGRGERQRDHLDALTSQRTELMRAQEEEVKRAVREAKETQRAEFELQTKVFAVVIRPYVNVSTVGSWFVKKYKSVQGVQYQLLVNGIPAFTPTIVEENVETIEVWDEDTKRLLISGATDLAKTAISLYLGGASQYVQLADAKVSGPSK